MRRGLAASRGVGRALTSTGLVLLASLTGCTTDCTDLQGSYPPDRIIIVGAESVDVPYLAWECPGYNWDSFEPIPDVVVDPSGELRIDVSLQEGTSVDIRVGADRVPVSPATGDILWTVAVPRGAEGVSVRLCSEDDACAIYVAQLQTADAVEDG